MLIPPEMTALGLVSRGSPVSRPEGARSSMRTLARVYLQPQPWWEAPRSQVPNSQEAPLSRQEQWLAAVRPTPPRA